MATRDRREFIPQALRCFLRQSYENSELIVVDDGRDPVGDLCQGLPRVRYIRLHRPATTGTKLNIGIKRARGAVLQKLDDDDYYHADFLKLALARLPSRTCARTMVAWDTFLIFLAGEPRLHYSVHGWAAGGTFCFYRKLWQRHPFRDVSLREDYWFVNDHRPRMLCVDAAEHYILLRNYSDVCFEYWVRRQVFPPEERVGSPIGWLDASAWPRFFVDVLHLGWPRWFRHTPLGFSPWCRRSPRSCGRSRWWLRRAPVWSSSGGGSLPSG